MSETPSEALNVDLNVPYLLVTVVMISQLPASFFKTLFSSDKCKFTSGTIHYRTEKYLLHVLTVFEELPAFFEDPNLIRKEYVYFLCMNYVGKC